MKRDQLNDTYLDLIEKQRLYFKTVKDFKEVCSFINELITRLNLFGPGHTILYLSQLLTYSAGLEV